jgi:hypothetical protein
MTEPTEGTIRIDWRSTGHQPDGRPEFDWRIDAQPPIPDEWIEAILSEIAERI